MKFRLLFWAVFLSCIIACASYCQIPNSKIAPPSLKAASSYSLPSSKIEFIENKGQLADQNGHLMPEVLYSSDSKGMKCYLTAKGMHFVFNRVISSIDSVGLSPRVGLHGLRNRLPNKNDTLILQRLDMEFAGANPRPRIEAQNMTDAYYNYYLAHCKLHGVRGYRKITYHDLYPHIDFIIYSKDDAMKYDFIVHPGGNPNVIAMRYGGMDSMQCSADGKFRIYSPLGKIEEDEPYSYQGIDEQIKISSRFFISQNELKFKVGNYDRRKDLVIDPPTRLWGTYYGGSGDDSEPGGITIDHSGNIVLLGTTWSSSNIATAGAYKTTEINLNVPHPFVAKFTQDDSLIWATYYGGNDYDNGIGILCTDSSDDIYIGGQTYSLAGIATPGANQPNHGNDNGATDDYLAKFDPTGALLWGTYFGGEGGELPGGAATDASGNVFICGSTTSSTNIGTAGSYMPIIGRSGQKNCFLAKFNSSGAIQWGTYYAGGGNDEADNISVDHSGNVIIVGGVTSSIKLATTGAYQTVKSGKPGAWNGYIAKFNTSGNLLWGTYYGGNPGSDALEQVCIGDSNNIYAAGWTQSTSSIASPGAFQTSFTGTQDMFIVKFDSSGIRKWATYYGGDSLLWATGIGFGGGNIYCLGNTNCTTGLSTPDGFQPDNGGEYDLIVAKFTASEGKRLWASYYGSPGWEQNEGHSLVVDNYSNFIIAGGTTDVTGIATPGSYQPNYGGGGSDEFLVKFCDVPTPILNGIKDTICSNTRDTFIVSGGNYTHIYWHDGPTALSWLNDKKLYIIPDTLAAGLHSFTVTGESTPGCDATSDTAFLYIHIKPYIYPGHDTALCAGEGSVLRAVVKTTAPPYTFSWTPTTDLNNPNMLTPIATPSKTTLYHLRVTDAFGCMNEDSVLVKVNPQPQLILKSSDSMCAGTNIIIGDSAHGGTPPYIYSWSPTAGVSMPDRPFTYIFPQQTTVYTETITDANGCSAQAKINVVVKPVPIPSIIPSGSASFCMGDSVILRLDKKYKSYSWSDGSFGDTLIVKQGGIYTVQVADTNGCYGNSNSILVTVTPLHPGIMPDSAISLCDNSGAVLYADKGYEKYLWSDGSTADSLIPPKPGKYFVFVTDQNGCQGWSDTITVKQSSLAPVIEGANSACPQSTTSYFANGNKNDTFTWTLTGGGTIKNSPQQDSIDVQWTTVGIWTLHVSESNALGCMGDTNITINVSSTLAPVITPNGNISVCEGDSIVLYAGKGYTSYKWSDGSIADSLIIKRAGNYSVTVTGNGGCIGTSATVKITIVPLPIISSISADGPLFICPGGTRLLEANVVNPSGFTKFLWNTGDTTQTIIVNKVGTYNVTATNPAGCVSAPMQVTIDSAYRPQIIGPTSICIGEGAENYSTPFDDSVSYHWVVSNGTFVTGQGTNSVMIQWNDATFGIGTLTLIDSVWHGCVDTVTITITIDATLHPVITAIGPLSFCVGDSVTLDAGSGYKSYQWLKDGGTITDATNEFLRVAQSGNYSVTVTSSGGCSGSSQTVGVNVFPLPAQPIISQQSNTLISTFASSYQWSFNGKIISGATGQIITPADTGNYTVVITDSNGCSNTSLPYHYKFAAGATAIVRVGAVPSVNPGSSFEAPIELVASQNLIPANADHYIGSLRYNATMLVPTGSRNGMLRQTQVSGSTERIVGFEGNSSPMTSGILQWIKFDAVLGDDTCTVLTIDTFYWTDANVTVTRENGNFCESGICIAGGTIRLIDASGKFGISPIRPNPSSSHITVEYDLMENGRTRLMLSDALGRTIRIIKDEDENAGHYREDVSLEEISSGYYQVLLKTPSQFILQSFVVQK